MDVILTQDVEKLGLRGDVVSVARGYARNFLFPRKLAETATAAKVAELRKRDERRALHEARSSEQGETIAETLRKTVLRFEMKAGPGGALFGSVTPSAVADELWRVRKIRVDRRKIQLSEPLKRVGTYLIPIAVYDDIVAEVKTLVVPEGGELPPEEGPVETALGEEGETSVSSAPDAVDESATADGLETPGDASESTEAPEAPSTEAEPE